MKDMTVPIDRAGRIVLPKDIREDLAIKPGDTLTVTVHGSSLTLTPNKETTGFIRKGKALVFATAGGATLSHDTVSRLLEESRDERHGFSLAGLREGKRKG